MRKIIQILCTCFLVLSLSACGEAIEDTNGENNTSLNTITKEEILSNSITSSGLGYSESNTMGITSFEYQDKNFNGVEEVFRESYLFSSGVSVDVSYIELESGNFRMYVIHEGKILKEIEPGVFNESYLFEDIEGEFYIRVAGESAKVEFNFNVY